MKTQDLEQVIREYLKDIYHKVYIGKIKVEKLHPIGYAVSIGLDRPLQPDTIYAELDDAAFIPFLKQELKDKCWHLVDWGELNLREPVECHPIDRSCSCHDKR